MHRTDGPVNISHGRIKYEIRSVSIMRQGICCAFTESPVLVREKKNCVINIHVKALAVIYSKNVLQLDSVFVFHSCRWKSLWNTT